MALRAISQLVIGAQAANPLMLIVMLIFAGLYIAAVIGLVQRRKWGAVITLLIGILDILSAFGLGGPQGIGAGIVDIIIISIAYWEYKMLSSFPAVPTL